MLTRPQGTSQGHAEQDRGHFKALRGKAKAAGYKEKAKDLGFKAKAKNVGLKAKAKAEAEA